MQIRNHFIAECYENIILKFTILRLYYHIQFSLNNLLKIKYKVYAFHLGINS